MSRPRRNRTPPTRPMARRCAAAKEGGSLLPPKHILNAPTKLMKSEGYGSGYDYDHDAPEAFSGQDYFPEALGRQQFYDPPERGFEREIRKRLEYWAKLRKEQGDVRIGFGCRGTSSPACCRWPEVLPRRPNPTEGRWALGPCLLRRGIHAGGDTADREALSVRWFDANCSHRVELQGEPDACTCRGHAERRPAERPFRSCWSALRGDRPARRLEPRADPGDAAMPAAPAKPVLLPRLMNSSIWSSAACPPC